MRSKWDTVWQTLAATAVISAATVFAWPGFLDFFWWIRCRCS